MMKTVQSLLCAQLDFDSGARDLVADFQNVALDVLGECCYGMSFDMVKNNTHPLIEARRELMQFVPMRIAFYLMFAWIPIGFRLDEWLLSFHPINAIQRFYRQFTIDVIARRKREMEEGNLPASSTEKRHDILQSLLDVGGDDPEENLSDIQIVSETNFFLTAGSETTALIMMWTVLLVYLDPVILAKLRRELDGAFPDVEFRRDLGTPRSVSFTPLPDETLRRLPYLDACIKEAMRFLPPAAMGFNRDTDVDCKLGGYQIPKGTTICVSLYTMHRSPELWERADEFWPERWIDPPEEDGGEGPKRCNRACYYPFSGGTRSCIAMNFAWQEVGLRVQFVELWLIVSSRSDAARSCAPFPISRLRDTSRQPDLSRRSESVCYFSTQSRVYSLGQAEVARRVLGSTGTGGDDTQQTQPADSRSADEIARYEYV